MHTSIPNMKFLCLNVWLGDVCTDDDGQGSLVNNPNEPKFSLAYLETIMMTSHYN